MPAQQSTDLNRNLETITQSEPKSLRCAVAQEALDYDCQPSFFNDLLTNGCVSGMVSSLIYYTDTHAFYDEHYDEIEQLRLQAEEDQGQPLCVHGDYKNFMAWFAFEQTAYIIALEFGVID